MDRLDRQIQFILEIDKLKHVLRRNFITIEPRRENDAEHSWHFAMAVLILAEYSPEPVDLLRTAKMALIHDIVEIDTGDTFIYDTENRRQMAEKEHAAARRLFGILPEDQADELRALWDEFEAHVTPESKFARALDRLVPILLNYHTQGRAWRENGITFERVRDLNLPVIQSGAPTLMELVEHLLLDANEKGYFHEG